MSRIRAFGSALLLLALPLRLVDELLIFRLRLPHPQPGDVQLAPGQELQDVLLVDWRAVDSENGKSYVYVLEDDMVQKRYVAPGLCST